MSFKFESDINGDGNDDSDFAPKNIGLSKLGNATVPTAYIGKNVIWAEFSDENSYYESKKVSRLWW